MPQFERELYPETNDFVSSYLETAEFADKPEEEDWSEAKWAPEAILKANSDCVEFQRRANVVLSALTVDSGIEHPIAHDFWLTRQGHGAGFWDGDYPEPQASELTKIAQSFGEAWIYKGDDGLIHFLFT